MHLHRVPVDPGSVGAFEVSQDDPAAVFLHFRVETTHPFVVELDPVVLFPADCDRGKEVFENAAALHPLQNLKCQRLHLLSL